MRPLRIDVSFVRIVLLVSALAGSSRAELNRVTTTRDASGHVTREEQPVDEHSEDHRRRPNDRDHDHEGCVGFTECILNAFLGVLFNDVPAEPAHVEPVHVDLPRSISTNSTPPSGDDRIAFMVDSGYAYSRIFNKLNSHFSSPSFSQIHWDDSLNLKAHGADASFLFGVADYFYVGLNAGGFGNSYTTNAQNENNVFVQEHISLSGGWGAMLLRLYPTRWFALEGSLGTMIYHVHSQVVTNAPLYQYDGFEGEHAVGLAGIGARFETPWRYPLKLYVGGRYWWNGGDSSPTIETGVAQFESGISYKF